MNALKKTLVCLLVVAAGWGCKKAEDPGPPPPDMVLTASATNANAGQNISFNIENPVDNIGSIRWDFGDGSTPINTNDLSRTYSFYSAGTYTVTAQVFNTSGSSVTLSQTVTIAGQVYQNGKLTYARVQAYNANENLWDNEYTGTERLPDVYIRVRARQGNDYQVLLAQSSVLQNFQVNGNAIPFSEVPFGIDGLDLLEVTLFNNNVGQGRPDNVISTFSKSKAELKALYGQNPSSLDWEAIDGLSTLYVTFIWD